MSAASWSVISAPSWLSRMIIIAGSRFQAGPSLQSNPSASTSITASSRMRLFISGESRYTVPMVLYACSLAKKTLKIVNLNCSQTAKTQS